MNTDNKMQDPFEDDILEESRGFQNILTIVAVVIAAGGFFALSWYAYNSYNTAISDDIPLITADSSPRKITPSDPGGMDFPNMDKKVYSKFSKNGEKIKVERILPSPEEPLSKEEIIKEYTPKEIEKETITIPVEEVAETQDELPKTIGDVIEEKENIIEESVEQKISENPQPIVKQKKVEEVNDVSSKIEIKQIPNSKVKISSHVKKEYSKKGQSNQKKDSGTIQKLPQGSKFKKSDFKTIKSKSAFKVQIASFKSEKDAQKSWKNQLKASAGILDSHVHFVEKKIIQGKGLVYRLQVGNFKNESQAAELCKKLKTKNIDCFTIRP